MMQMHKYFSYVASGGFGFSAAPILTKMQVPERRQMVDEGYRDLDCSTVPLAIMGECGLRQIMNTVVTCYYCASMMLRRPLSRPDRPVRSPTTANEAGAYMSYLFVDNFGRWL
jgi:hypothetical protein